MQKGMKNDVLVLFGAVCLCFHTAHAQIESGTVIVLQLTKNEFVIAADSRAFFPNKPPEDTHCKIAALDSQFVFGVDAAASYTPGEADIFRPSWTAIGEAKRIARTYPAASLSGAEATVNAIADSWAISLKDKWSGLYAVYPDRVSAAAKMGNGVLTNGFFALAHNHVIGFAVRSITFDGQKVNASVPPLPFCKAKPCAAGKNDVTMEFIKLTRSLSEK